MLQTTEVKPENTNYTNLQLNPDSNIGMLTFSVNVSIRTT